jgi:hypothetical protein
VAGSRITAFVEKMRNSKTEGEKQNKRCGKTERHARSEIIELSTFRFPDT